MTRRTHGTFNVVAALVLAIAAGSVTGCDTGEDGTAVGPRGGIVTSDDGRVTLDIPAGALADVVQLRIVEATELPEDAIGPAYEVLPAGVTFSIPAEVAYDVADGADIDPSAVQLVIERDENWRPLADRDVDMANLEVSASMVYSATVAIVE
ncbi:MAG: hypothetical protein JKY37_18540 [Nannocystaceae bacterium]|nr:hypothetical protein [Nannocystaceae bacterium]